ncbi:MAG: L,D-transpeptidase family protein [Fimbriimonadaceae bacterium]|nr:L,D-transpeptidase family protein [Fimbriimonadaceae bacterium]
MARSHRWKPREVWTMYATWALLMLGPAVVSAGCGMPEADRASEARVRVESALAETCEELRVTYPPRVVHFRAFKRERELETWIGNAPTKLVRLRTDTIAGLSGELGPKRREGDRQVPEGVYVVDRFNPKSRFHLSLGINYPNASDRVFADADRPGSDIFIHGGTASIGCLAMTDPVIESLYTLARGAKSPVTVHLFPCRFPHDARPESELWRQLAEIQRDFSAAPRVQRVEITRSGAYRLRRSRSREAAHDDSRG